MSDLETVIRRMIAVREEMIEENRGHIDDLSAKFKNEPVKFIEVSIWFADRITQNMDEIDLLKGVLLQGGIEF